ncbi:MAG: SET domain-containing protein [Patescibacteria group bacterium]
MPKSIFVKKSKICGRGVFAGRNFKKGETVIKWKKPRIITKSRASKLPPGEKNYLVGKSKNRYILMQPPERYVNHSCEANTRVKNMCDVASKNIKKGEEITSFYTAKTAPITFLCRCGSKNCRKIIPPK